MIEGGLRLENLVCVRGRVKVREFVPSTLG